MIRVNYAPATPPPGPVDPLPADVLAGPDPAVWAPEEGDPGEALWVARLRWGKAVEDQAWRRDVDPFDIAAACRGAAR